MSTLYEKLTHNFGRLVCRAGQQWNGMSTGQRVLTAIGGAFASVSSYVLYYRITEKMSNKFNSYTSSREAINGLDLTNKVAIVTGCNTGIGKETAKVLYEQGCTVIMACRNMKKAEAARSDIINSTDASTGTIAVMQLDLSSLQSVYDFAVTFSNDSSALDYLILNAGIMALPEYKLSADGYEMQFAVNHLAHFYLTMLLMPLLIENKGRVISLSSTAHRFINHFGYQQFLKDGIQKKQGPSEERYNQWRNYGLSKVSNILFAREVHRRYADKGVTACSCHPGAIPGSELGRNVVPGIGMLLMAFKLMLNLRFLMENFKTLDQGAATTLRCVSLTDSELRGGHYYTNCQSGRDKGKLKAAGKIRKYENYEEESSEVNLWKLSETLITQKGFAMKL